MSYLIAGFYFMYLMKKLALNPALADAKRAVDRLQISSSVSTISTRVTEKLPPGLLLGREFVEDIEELHDAETAALRADLFSVEVESFLKACEDDAAKGVMIQPDSVMLAARFLHLRVYFDKESTDERRVAQEKAIDWIMRVLVRDPINPEFQLKLADAYGMQGRYDEAVSIVERVERQDISPQYTQQWLGYFLLFIDGRENDAIRHSLEFHSRFPDESSALYNASCGFAQLYTAELRAAHAESSLDSSNRLMSLKHLREAIQSDSDIRITLRRDLSPGASFESMTADAEFLQLASDPRSAES